MLGIHCSRRWGEFRGLSPRFDSLPPKKEVMTNKNIAIMTCLTMINIMISSCGLVFNMAQDEKIIIIKLKMMHMINQMNLIVDRLAMEKVPTEDELNMYRVIYENNEFQKDL